MSWKLSLRMIFVGSILLPLVISATETLPPPTSPPRIQISTVKVTNTGALEKKEQATVGNSTQSIIFPEDIHSVELHCSSFYPVKWEFIYKGISLPFVDVHYKRVFNPVSLTNSSSFSLEDLKAEANNAFVGIVTLEKHLQSQTGRYVCSHFNSKLLNNSHGIAAYVDVFIPGNYTFYEVPHVQFINSSTVSSIVIPCTVTDPSVQVKLFRLNEQVYKLRRQFVWKPIEGRYDPMKGFELQAGLGRILLGDYKCSTGDSHIIISVNDVSHEVTLDSHGVRKPCLEDVGILKMVRSKRLECFCRDSYALFATDEEESNRRGNCPSGKPSLGNETEGGQQIIEKCLADWRVLEFLGTEESSSEEKVCYRDPIREGLNGTGTRFFLRVSGRRKSDGRLNLTVLFDGSPTWADGFKLVVRSGNEVQLISEEPTRTQKYPLAQYTAVWESLIIGNNVESISVFQPLPQAYEWFGVVEDLTKIHFEDEIHSDNGSYHLSTGSSSGGSTHGNNLMYWTILALVINFIIRCESPL